MKVRRLKRKADALAADARLDRLTYRTHAGRSLAIVRRRARSTAGLAILFSLGFMAGAGANRGSGGGGSTAGRLARAALGDHALKLLVALIAHSLMKPAAGADYPCRAGAPDTAP